MRIECTMFSVLHQFLHLKDIVRFIVFLLAVGSNERTSISEHSIKTQYLRIIISFVYDVR